MQEWHNATWDLSFLYQSHEKSHINLAFHDKNGYFCEQVTALSCATQNATQVKKK
jgi:hypothetical protein